MTDFNVEELTRLVDWERGLISPRIFTDQEIFEHEMKQVFGRTWQFLAHESQFSKPGDFFSTYIGLDPVLVVKQRDGSIKALLNACRHRGMRVCRADSGNLKAFTCTYHGWTYDTAGKLVNVPFLEDAYHNELETEKWGLIEIPQVDNYKGLIFGNVDAEAPPLLEFLGDMTWYLDALVDRREGGTVVAPHIHKITFKGNWKLAAEQFAGDSYHVPMTHVSASEATKDPDNMVPPPDGYVSNGRQYASRQGHGMCLIWPNPAEVHSWMLRDLGFDHHADYFDRITPEIEGRLGKERPFGAIGNVFPSFGLLPGFHDFVTWHPKTPNTFEEWRWTILDTAASPEEHAQQIRTTTVHRSGLFDADDGENWGEIGRNLTGPLAQNLMLNYTMGVGHERDDDKTYPGRIGYHLIGETPQRGFYRRWVEFMQSKTWPHVANEPA